MTEVIGGLGDNLNIDESEVEIPEVDSREVKEVVRVQSDETKKITERPETLPEQFWDEKTGAIKTNALVDQYAIDQKRITDLRKTISKGLGGTLPESEDEYEVEFDETTSKFVNDESLTVAKKAALAAGISKEQFNKFAPQYIKGLVESGMLNENMLPKSEEDLAALEEAEIKQHREEQMKILGDGGQRIIDSLTDRVATLYKKGSLNKEDLIAFKEAAYDARGVLFLQKWIDLHGGTQTIPTDTNFDRGLATKEELDAMAGDPRMSDPVFRAKRSEGYRRLEQEGRLPLTS